ncbi:hypothetical protein AALO_G00121610 [Alosa alosa]|uniref:Uncharacterized protein n=1 Tax=Alosa alosa TaxID=278164 RepID=A0AAV6GK10_9TELE|nr:hypothetical protein AALO_G00121610 [Alosa alosa]
MSWIYCVRIQKWFEVDDDRSGSAVSRRSVSEYGFMILGCESNLSMWQFCLAKPLGVMTAIKEPITTIWS